MTDPEEVARAIYAVQRAMEGWQEAALVAISACREEHQSASETVEMSGQAAMEVRIGVENLSEELGRFQSSADDSRHDLAAVVNRVETSTRRHQALAEHVARTQAVWSGHLEQAREDHQVAARALNDASWSERAALGRLQAAQAEAKGTAGGSKTATAMIHLGQLHADYDDAFTRLQRAAVRERTQGARVERCTRALTLAQQAAQVLESGTTHLSTATQAVETGQARLREVEEATNTAHAHLANMAEHASEAVSHANRADQHLTTATRHLDESEEWLQRGYVLANDAALDMSEQIRQLQLADTPMGGGDAAGGSASTDLTQRSAEQEAEIFADLDRVKANTGASVAARFVLGKRSFTGTNLARDHSPIKGTFSFFVQHAEGDVFAQLINSGGYEGDSGTLYVTRNPCGFCTSSISAAARSMQLSRVRIVTQRGLFGTYTPETGLVRGK